MTDLLESLNENQLRAIKFGDKPTLVIAGPGSGKTRTLVAKVVSILKATESEGDRVVALTFTNKAANEMLVRISEEFPDVGARCVATTFHSFASDVLRQHGHLVGMSPDFSMIATDAERESFLSVSAKELHDERKRLKGVLETVGKCGTPDELSSEDRNLLERYRDVSIEANRLDMNLVLSEAIGVVQVSSGVQDIVRVQYPFVCVDEFQDSNSAQMKFLRLVAAPDGERLFVVADDDQLIYGWNGASTERLVELRERYSPEVIQLPENYRCCPSILQLANRLIENNSIRDVSKEPLVPVRKESDDDDVRCCSFENEGEEHRWLRGDIAERVAAGQHRIVVLGRNRKALERLLKELQKEEFKSVIVVRKDEFSSAVMRLVHKLLKFANCSSDELLASQVDGACKEVFKTTPGFQSQADGEECEVAWREFIEGLEHVPKSIRESFGAYSEVLEDGDTVLVWIERILAAFEEYLSESEKAMVRLEEDIAGLREIVSELELQFGDGLSLSTFAQELDMRSKAPTPPDGCVLLLTIHGAKGLEFQHVYLSGMQDGSIPDFRAVRKGPQSAEIEEERRGCFVAVTRAESTVTFTYAESSNGYKNEPSRFLREMGVIN